MLTREDEAFDAGRLLCGELDGLLVEHGFAPGQIGVRPGEASVVFCTPLADLRRRYPVLAPDLRDESAGACADVNVSVDVDDEPRVADVHLDGHGLDAMLRDAGRPDLVPEAAVLGRLAYAEALGLLHHLLAAVLDGASVGAASAEAPRPPTRPPGPPPRGATDDD